MAPMSSSSDEEQGLSSDGPTAARRQRVYVLSFLMQKRAARRQLELKAMLLRWALIAEASAEAEAEALAGGAMEETVKLWVRSGGRMIDAAEADLQDRGAYEGHTRGCVR